MADTKYQQQSPASEAQFAARQRLCTLFDEPPLPRQELLVNLGLYTRASALARIFFLNVIFELITAIAGCVMKFGYRACGAELSAPIESENQCP